MPLGVYPNLGRYLDPRWKFDEKTGPEDYAEMALQWRDEGARIVGGCCGVTPEHMAAVRTGLDGTRPGKGREVVSELAAAVINDSGIEERVSVIVQPWVDGKGKHLYPLSFPEIGYGSQSLPSHPGKLSGLEAPFSVRNR